MAHLRRLSSVCRLLRDSTVDGKTLSDGCKNAYAVLLSLPDLPSGSAYCRSTDCIPHAYSCWGPDTSSRCHAFQQIPSYCLIPQRQVRGHSSGQNVIHTSRCMCNIVVPAFNCVSKVSFSPGLHKSAEDDPGTASQAPPPLPSILERVLPRVVLPYAQLMRLHAPIGKSIFGHRPPSACMCRHALCLQPARMS